jgi:hypothetical protein
MVTGCLASRALMRRVRVVVLVSFLVCLIGSPSFVVMTTRYAYAVLMSTL